jgi:acetyltransferase-like isoleucine patch superfamily enzyme
MTKIQKKTHAAITGEGSSALQRYRQVIVGRDSMASFLYFEWCGLLSIVPGAAGLVLRKVFWPRLFGQCGKGTIFGSQVVLRHPHRIKLGKRVIISDGCILDARNDGEECAMFIGDDTMLANDVMLSCKSGTIEYGARGGIGAKTVIHSVNHCPVRIGEDVMIGPGCYIAGGGNYHIDRTDIPMSRQGLREDEGVTLGNDIWMGANVTILAGVGIGSGSVVAAGAVVNRSVGERLICGGVPARVLKARDGSVRGAEESTRNFGQAPTSLGR